MGSEEPIEAVAERIIADRKARGGPGSPYVNASVVLGFGEYAPSKFHRDEDYQTLVDAMLARLISDRAEASERAKPIDEEFVIATLGGSMSFKADALDGATVTVWATRLSPSGFELGIAHGDTEYVHNLTITTRGQLLDLLAALGVERKGGG